MDEKRNSENQSGYDQSTFGKVNGSSYHQDSYHYSQKYNGQQNLFGQQRSGQSHAQFQQTPPDGGAFYHSGEPPRGMGFGIASMVLGIISIVLFCTCINIPFAILAVIFGIFHLTRRTGNNGFAIAGIVTACVSMILTAILTVAIYVLGINSAAGLYNGYFPFGDYFYDDYGDYYYDDDYDYDDYFDRDEFEGVDF